MFKKTVIYMFGQIASFLISMMLLPIYTKILSPDDYGRYNLFLAIVTSGVTLFTMGLNTAFMIKYYKISEIERQKLFTFINILFLFSLILGAFAFPFLSLFKNYFGSAFNYLHLIILIGVVMTSVYYSFYSALLRVQQRVGAFLFYTLGYTIVGSGLSLLFLIKFHYSYWSFMYSGIIVNVLFTIIGVILYKNQFSTLFFKILKDGGIWKSTFKLSFPTFLSQISTTSLLTANRFLLKGFSQTAAVGLFSIGFRFGSMMESFFLTPFFNTYNPTAYKTYFEDEDKFESLQKKTLDIYLFCWILIMLFGGIFFKDFFQRVIDTKYWEGYKVIPIILMSYFVLGINYLVSVVYTVKEKMKLGFIISVSASVLNIILNILLIPKFHIYGAAFATLFSFSLSMLLSIYFNSKLHFINYRWISYIIPVVATGILMFFQNIYFSEHIIVIWAVRLLMALFGLIVTLFFLKEVRTDLYNFVLRKINLNSSKG